MLYTEFINKAINETIAQADNGLFYLEPMWKTILHDDQLFFDKISDYKIKPDEIKEVLELEVQKRNTVNSLLPDVLNWVHDIITASVEPAMLQEETDYLKNLTEYLKANKEALEITDNNSNDIEKQ